MSFETVRHQWQQGLERLDEAPRERLRTYTRVAEAIYEELRRRLGSSFLIDELVDHYEQGTRWAEELAMQTAPGDPWAWESRIVVDAAYGRYVREASDYAGGRRITATGG
jgi:hypothetical protein